MRRCEHARRIEQAVEGLTYWRLGQATEKERAEATRTAVLPTLLPSSPHLSVILSD